MGLVAPRHVGSSQTRARTRVPCIGRRILNHCTTRETSVVFFFVLTIYWISWGPTVCHYANPQNNSVRRQERLRLSYRWGKQRLRKFKPSSLLPLCLCYCCSSCLENPSTRVFHSQCPLHPSPVCLGSGFAPVLKKQKSDTQREFTHLSSIGHPGSLRHPPSLPLAGILSAPGASC